MHFNPPAAVAVSGGLLYQHCINNMAAKKKVGGKSCWKGYSAQGTKKGKGGKRVNNCVKNGKK